MNDQTDVTEPTRVECPAAKDPPTRLLIMALVAVGFGLYCAYDIWVAGKYDPEEKYLYYLMNLAGFVILVPVGLVFLVKAIAMFRRVLVADAEGIGYEGKPRIPWGQVKRLAMADKGLLHVHYGEEGSLRVLKLDSWKLKNYAELIALIENKTPDVPIE